MRKPINTNLRPMLIWSKFADSNNMVGIVEFTGYIEETFFKQALDVIQKRHPFLATRIEDLCNTHFSRENVPQIPGLVLFRMISLGKKLRIFRKNIERIILRCRGF